MTEAASGRPCLCMNEARKMKEHRAITRKPLGCSVAQKEHLGNRHRIHRTKKASRCHLVKRITLPGWEMPWTHPSLLARVRSRWAASKCAGPRSERAPRRRASSLVLVEGLHENNAVWSQADPRRTVGLMPGGGASQSPRDVDCATRRCVGGLARGRRRGRPRAERRRQRDCES